VIRAAKTVPSTPDMTRPPALDIKRHLSWLECLRFSRLSSIKPLEMCKYLRCHNDSAAFGSPN
ncbi:MAG: hypothetical protein V1792_08565, partial [Pseudomonadota bacterium]